MLNLKLTQNAPFSAREHGIIEYFFMNKYVKNKGDLLFLTYKYLQSDWLRKVFLELFS